MNWLILTQRNSIRDRILRRPKIPATSGWTPWAGFALMLWLLAPATARAAAGLDLTSPPVASGKPLPVKIGLFISNLSGIQDKYSRGLRHMVMKVVNLARTRCATSGGTAAPA